MDVVGVLFLHGVLAVILHEGGHALGAWLVGAPVRGVRVRGGLRTVFDMPAAGWSARSFSVVMGAGVVVNLVVAIAVLPLGLPAVVMHALCAMVNVFPSSQSDGRALWLVWCGRLDEAIAGHSPRGECSSATPTRMNT